MRVLLLAAGYGTRLRPLTETVPKCLVAIAGKPLLEIWLERLTRAGLGPFLINTHYLASLVEDFIATSPYQDAVTLVHEPTLLGTAGTLLANLDFFQGEEGLLIHADNYCLADFQAFIKAHRQRPPECLMTMMTFRTNTPESCGIVELDRQGIVIGFHEKVESPPGNLANGAIYLLSPVLLKMLPTDFARSQDFSNDILPKLVSKIYTYEAQQTLLDIGTPNNYAQANQLPDYLINF